MENIFLNCIQLVNENRFWAMPAVVVVEIVIIVHMISSAFRRGD